VKRNFRSHGERVERLGQPFSDVRPSFYDNILQQEVNQNGPQISVTIFEKEKSRECAAGWTRFAQPTGSSTIAGYVGESALDDATNQF
jgi:hypothetical protein